MRILHVTTTDPSKTFGGVASAVKNLAKGYEVRFYNSSGILGVLKAKALAKRLAKENWGLIHFHDSIAAYFYLKAGGTAKTVYTSHGHWTTFFEKLPPSGWVAKIKAKKLVCYQNYVTSKADCVVAVSNKIKSVIENNSSPKNIAVIYNGVDTKTFRPMGLKRGAAIWVGKDPVRKRLDKTIDYARKHGMKLIVVGLDKMPFDTNGIEIETHKNVSDEELARLYNRSKILPFFSEQEGHPLVVLEAMACGCDILASEETNVEILPLKGGFYRASGTQARKVALRYDWDKIRDEYKKLYQDTLS